MSSRVSVILTSYNRPEWLRNAIDSVFAQTYEDWELFILDDNSSDPKVFEVISEYLNDLRVHYFNSGVEESRRKETCRYATLINFGLYLSTGKYVTYLTDDDHYLPHRFERMVSTLESVDTKVVYGFQWCYNDGDVEGGYVRGQLGPLPRAACMVDHCSVMHTRDIAFEVGLWDVSPEVWGHGDAAFWDRLNDAGYDFYCIPEILDHHRFHAGSVQSKMSEGKLPYETD